MLLIDDIMLLIDDNKGEERVGVVELLMRNNGRADGSLKPMAHTDVSILYGIYTIRGKLHYIPSYILYHYIHSSLYTIQ